MYRQVAKDVASTAISKGLALVSAFSDPLGTTVRSVHLHWTRFWLYRSQGLPESPCETESENSGEKCGTSVDHRTFPRRSILG